MTNLPSLHLRNHHFDAAALRAGVALANATPNEQYALDFCRRWLAGEAHFLLHTSGSTGEPKPIHLTRRQMEASADGTAAALGLGAGMRALVCMPTHYVAGTMMLVRGLRVGMAMHLIEPAANPLAHFGGEIDFTAVVPLQLAAMLDDVSEAADAQRARLQRAHAILVGGGALSAALEQRVMALKAPTYHSYGMTETVSHVALRRLDGVHHSDAFTPLPGVRIALDDRGCLRVCGGMTEDIWVQTNDLATINADGAFVWQGRIDNVINSGGVKVSIEPLERAIEPLLVPFFPDALPRFIVAGLPDARLGQQVALLIEAAPMSEEQTQAILATLRRAELPRYHAPRTLHTLPRFTETPTGKIDRKNTVQTLFTA